MDPPAPFHPTATRRSRVQVGVGVVVVRPEDGHVYVGIRRNSHGAGLLALPGGHLEMYEEWENCARREVEEEMNLSLDDVQFLHVTNDPMPNDNKHYVTIFMMGTATGEPVNAEPHKCEGWYAFEWIDLMQRNDDLFGPLLNLVRDNPSSLQQYIQQVLQR
ncbi:hypothetical protein FisN_24Lh172 [Fistulifera solaris]|uniref:Nudix hydrolase domain-containing protein n=1 Tax=Fistulifera solaris TaxID=1519565 RepID=A0A1Z5K9Q0_FISSO|nr:hypothetical protein FisN_24Lh172 [Fistulifera solaris]|eukprot:GAX22885.1 hypothetical protein FisN_24Lh172 [Fistulifera solaris]